MTEQLPLVRLVDDDADVREALAFLLESPYWEITSYGSADEFLRSDTPSRPGCLVLDYDMPQMSGLDLQEVMRQRGYNLPIVFLTGHGNIDIAVQATRRGAVDFLQKTASDMNERLLDAVQRAVGRSQEGFADLPLDPFEAQRRLTRLTAREHAVAEKIAAGFQNKQIAAQLGMSVRTAESHRASIQKKLEVKSVADLASLLHLAQGH